LQVNESVKRTGELSDLSRSNPPSATAAVREPNWIALAGLLAAAACLRMAVAHFRPNIIWPDEIFQVVEPAHRLVYGYGLIAWEYVVGMRSWLFPGAIASALWAGRFFGSAPAIGLTAVQLFMVAFSLLPVAAAYRWGERLDGVRGGTVVGGLSAVWVDLIYFAPHPLSDVIASDVLAAGLYAALPLTTRPSQSRLACAGALFGLTFALRMQLAPALAVAAAFACGRAPRAWGAVLLGGVAVLLPIGCLDWLTLGTPFQSIWLNYWLNVVKGVSSSFGTESPVYFPAFAVGLWGGAVLFLIVAQTVIGARRFPALFAIAVTIFVTQSIIQHKELRFFYPVYPLLIILCGIATVEEIRDIGAQFGKRFSASSAPAILSVALWTVISFMTATRPGYQAELTRRRELIDAFALAARLPSLCGLELLDTPWPASPGSAALPPGIPIYNNVSQNALHDSAGYNVAIVHHFTPSRAADFAFAGRYRRVACFDGTTDTDGKPQGTACVWVRGGACTPGVVKIPDPIWPAYFRNADGSPRLDRIRIYSPKYALPGNVRGGS
jgi:hypothetical protein